MALARGQWGCLSLAISHRAEDGALLPLTRLEQARRRSGALPWGLRLADGPPGSPPRGVERT